MRIQHNILAMNAYRNYNANTSALAKNLEKLSSGYRINRAGDDAAGLAISEKMRAQITGLNAAQKNVKDGISLVKTAEGATQEIQDMLNRMKYLATQSANGTYQNEVDRDNIQKEVNALRTEIDRIADSSNFNGINLLDGKLGLNTDAFEVLGAVQAAAGADKTSDVIVAGKEMPAAGNTAGTNTILHEDGGDAQKGFFTVDLSQIKITTDAAGVGTVTVNIGGAAITINDLAAGSETDAATLANKVVTKLAALGGAGLMVDGSGNIALGAAAGTKGRLLYTAQAVDGTIKFTATKYDNGTAWTNLGTGDLPNSDVLDGALVSPGWDVSITKGTNVNTVTGNPNIDATNTQTPLKAGSTKFGNTFLTIDVTKLTDGMEMTIAGETKTIGKGKDIDFSDLNLTQNADKLKAMDRITQAFADNQHVSVGQDATTADIGKLTLSEKVKADGTSAASEEMQQKMSDLDTFKSLVSFKGPDQVAGSQVKITSGQVKEGDVLTVDGTQYVFTKDLTGKTDSNDTKYVQFTENGTDAAQNFATKAGGTLGDDGQTVTIATPAGKAAPSILGKGLVLQIGDTAQDFNQLGVKVGDMHVKAMNSATGMSINDISVNTQQDAAKAIEVIKDAINYVSSIRGDLGATQNRLEHTANNLSVMAENIQDAESTIRDTDVAEEMMAYTKNNILVQAAQAMLAQANAVPQGVLQLLQ